MGLSDNELELILEQSFMSVLGDLLSLPFYDFSFYFL